MNLSYSEANGGFFYFSPYKQIRLENLKRKYILKQDNLHLKINKPDCRQRFETSEFTYYHTYNHLGLRTSDTVIPPQAFCIIGLGDSFTEGVGVPDDSTWCVLLENELNKYNCFENPARVINAGVYGSDPFYDFIRLKYLLKKIKPDLLILSINTSDIVDVMTRGGFERFQKNSDVVYKSSPWWEFFYSFSFIGRSIAHGVFNIQNTLMTPEQEKVQTELAENMIIKLILNYYNPLSLQYEFEIMVVFQPMLLDLEQNTNHLQKLYNKISKKEIDVIDLHAPFYEHIIQNGDKASSFFWSGDKHLNSSGTLMTAKFLSKEIANMNLVQ
ncbi:MAG: hypothetical protein PHT69_12255 [Bacteroidales bacterium]|nr:hypothetical protein [Bacteroidales bacterium]